MKISKTNQERLTFLYDCEIESIKYEGVVGLSSDYDDNFYVIQDGKIIDYLNTNDKISNVWSEYMESEGLYN